MSATNQQDYDSSFGGGIKRMLNGMFGVQSASGKKKERTRDTLQRETAPNLSMALHDVPVLMECDVLVVGGGPGGLSAALGAARAGADVVLMERFGCFGGVITTVGMETLAWYRYEGTRDGEGIGKEMERVAHRMGATEKFHYNDSECLNAEAFKLIADEMVRQNGIRPLLHCFATDVILEPAPPAAAGQPAGLPIIKGVIIESKAGRQCIRAKRVIDCTGDADIAHRAGTPFTQIKREESLGVTSVFNCSDIDKKKFLTWVEKNPSTYSDWGESWVARLDENSKNLRSPYFEKEFKQAADAGVIPKDNDFAGSWSGITDHGEATNLNLVHQLKCNALDPVELTKAEMEGRRRTAEAIAALRHSVPGWENAKLRNYSMTLGVRDSRKIDAVYNLTGQDVLEQGRFWDTIGIFPEFVDGYQVLTLPTTGRYFQVPLRACIPTKVDNLLVAGRCCGGDNVSHAAMRNMMACTVSGQGAGVAAAVSVQLDKRVHEFSSFYPQIKEALQKQQVSLDGDSLSTVAGPRTAVKSKL